MYLYTRYAFCLCYIYAFCLISLKTFSTVSSSILSAIKTCKCKLMRDEFKRSPYVMLNQKMHYLLTVKKDEYFEIIYTKHKPKMRYAPSVKDNGNSKSSRFVIFTVHKIISKKYAATFNI